MRIHYLQDYNLSSSDAVPCVKELRARTPEENLFTGLDNCGIDVIF